MKIFTLWSKRKTSTTLQTYSLIVLISLLYTRPLLAQNKIEIDSNFQTTTILYPFDNIDYITGVFINGQVTFYSDSAYCLIILKDSNYHEYLIYEGYTLLNGSNGPTQICNSSEETSFLPIIKPYSITISIANSFLHLDSINYSTTIWNNPDSLSNVSRYNLINSKVNTINNNINQKGLIWKASVNTYSLMKFSEKKVLLNNQENKSFYGLDYYSGGIFEAPPYFKSIEQDDLITESFDWRNRHGVNNVTSPYYHYNQENGGWIPARVEGQACADCWAQAPTYCLEGVVNLYYNKFIDKNLSQLQLRNCTYQLHQGTPYNCAGYNEEYAMDYLSSGGIMDECCGYYPGNYNIVLTCDDPVICSNPQHLLKTSGYGSCSSNLDDIKQKLITHGPIILAGSIWGTDGHAATLVGYNIVKAKEKIWFSTDPNNFIIIPENSIYIGQTYWIIKNSYATYSNNTSYLYLFATSFATWHQWYIQTPLLNLGSEPDPQMNDIAWADLDGDGFYWWGIGHKPTNCPGLEIDEDCDDSDPNVGPYDSNYGCTPICDFVDNPIHITSNTTISNDHFYNRNIIVKNNSKLVVTSTLSFAENTKIIVENGSQLIIDGGHLTSGCSSMWEGIEVWGDNNHTQYPENGQQYQGYVELKNGAIIENAHYAISLQNSGVWNTFGGIVKAYNTTFKNNWKSVEFMSYKNFYPTTGNPAPNQSRFDRCDFLVDNNFFWEGFDAQVSLWDVTGVYFRGCDFKDLRTNLTESGKMGKGINSLDANYVVKPYCDSYAPYPYTCPANDLKKSTFTGLSHGIFATNSATQNSITVSQCDFAANIYGVNLDKVNQARILQSTFHIGGNQAVNKPAHYGIATVNSTGYRIEENTFTGTGNTAVNTVGVNLFNCGTESNEVYKNSFTHLNSGEMAVALNRNPQNGFEGLQFTCNTNNNGQLGGSDITSLWQLNLPEYLKHGIRDFQGDLSHAAGNIFSQETSNSDESDIKNFTQNPFRYYHSGGAQEPLDYTAGRVFPVYDADPNSCASKLAVNDPAEPMPPGELDAIKQDLNENESAYRNLYYVYNQLLDGGNKDALINEIQLSWPEDAWQLRSELLSHSPFLSREVLESASDKNILPHAMLLEICLSNPDGAKSEAFLEHLEYEIPNPLPEYMIQLIRNARDSTTTRTNLEVAMAGYLSTASFQSNVLINAFKSDSSQFNPDSTTRFLRKRYRLPSYFQMIDLVAENISISAAGDSLLLLPSYFDLNSIEIESYNNFTTWLNFRETVANSNRSLMQLDSTEIAYLIGLGEAWSDFTGSAIRNLLCFGYHYCIPTDISGSGSSYRPSSTIQSVSTTIDKVKIYPNPANTYLTFKYEFTKSDFPANLTITDANGKIRSREKLNLDRDEFLIDTRAFTNGVYFYEVSGSKGIIQSGKIAIKH